MEDFSQVTSMQMGDRKRIENLVANSKLAKVTVLTEPAMAVSISFQTIRRGKPMVSKIGRASWRERV